MFFWWRQYLSNRRHNSSSGKRRLARRRPWVERLETRWTPSVTLLGTTGDDVFSFAADQTGYTLTLNGNSQFFTPAQESTFQIVGNGGNDTISIQGNSSIGPQTARLAPQSAQWSGPSYSVEVSDIESITVQGSPNDVAFLEDSSGDDAFTAWPADRTSCVACPASSSLSGPGYVNQARGFERVEASASTGNDTAVLYDSAGDDEFNGYSDFSYMMGDDYLYKASGFDRVDAYSTSGYDSAEMSDSAGDDIFVGNVDFSYLSGSRSINKASGFDRVSAYASTGIDSATLYDSAGNDTFVVQNALGYLLAQGGPWLKFTGFDRIEAFASTGNDEATLSDSAGDDTFIANPDFGYISGPGYRREVTGFDRVEAIASTGNDRATLSDSSGDDTFVSDDDSGYLTGSGYVVKASAFDRIDAQASTGNDTATLKDSPGDDAFVANPAYSYMAGSDFLIKVLGFDRVEANAITGNDTASLTGSTGDDFLRASSAFGYLTGPGYLAKASGFDRLDANASTGNDTAELYDSAGDDFFEATTQYGYMSGPGYLNKAWGFDRLDGFASSGTNATAIIGTPANEILGAMPDYSYLIGAGQAIKATGFNRVQLQTSLLQTGTAAGEGIDELSVQDGAGDDYVSVKVGSVNLNRSGYSLWVLGNFKRMVVLATTGNDELVISGGSLGNAFAGELRTSFAPSTGMTGTYSKLGGNSSLGVFDWYVIGFDVYRAVGRETAGSRSDSCLIYEPASPNYFVELVVSGLQLDVYWTDLSQPGAQSRLVYSCNNFNTHTYVYNAANRHVARFSPRQIAVDLAQFFSNAPRIFVSAGNDFRTLEF